MNRQNRSPSGLSDYRSFETQVAAVRLRLASSARRKRRIIVGTFFALLLFAVGIAAHFSLPRDAFIQKDRGYMADSNPELQPSATPVAPGVVDIFTWGHDGPRRYRVYRMSRGLAVEPAPPGEPLPPPGKSKPDTQY